MLRFLSVSICSAGLVLGQAAVSPSTSSTSTSSTPTASPATGTVARGRGPNGSFGPGRGPGAPGRGPSRGIDLYGRNAESRLTKQLSLDATQQNNLHTVIESAQVQRKGLAEKGRSTQKDLAAAIKAGNESLIESLSKDLENLHAQETTIHAKALASFYGSLNDSQKATIEPSLNRELGIPGAGGRGPGGRGPGGRGPRAVPGAAAQTTQQ